MSTPNDSLPSTFHFSIGGYFGECSDVAMQSDTLVVRQFHSRHKPAGETVVTPSREDWLQFWQAVEPVGIWQWQPEYIDHGILDGTQWSLKIVHGARTVTCEGSNAYPGGDGPEYGPKSDFAQFLKALHSYRRRMHPVARGVGDIYPEFIRQVLSDHTP